MALYMVNSIILWLHPWQVCHGVIWKNGVRKLLVPALAVFGSRPIYRHLMNVGIKTTASFGVGRKQIKLGSY
jgi:hypothetical protein